MGMRKAKCNRDGGIMKHRKTFRIDKLFGLATLVCLLVITLMVYNDFFKDTVSEGNVIGKETESETRTSGYLNDNKNVESIASPRRKRMES